MRECVWGDWLLCAVFDGLCCVRVSSRPLPYNPGACDTLLYVYERTAQCLRHLDCIMAALTHSRVSPQRRWAHLCTRVPSTYNDDVNDAILYVYERTA